MIEIREDISEEVKANVQDFIMICGCGEKFTNLRYWDTAVSENVMVMTWRCERCQRKHTLITIR
jgi:predicted SprT family Zn-dependent metalloprotease